MSGHRDENASTDGDHAADRTVDEVKSPTAIEQTMITSPAISNATEARDSPFPAPALSDEDELAMSRTWIPACEDDPAANATITIAKHGEVATVASVHVTERTVAAAQASESDPPALADYQLLNVLGKGGMGVVWQARQLSINRSVALKMVLEDSQNKDTASQKFLEEAIITGDLEHQNIVPIYDLGRTPNGHLFYAMKQVQGTPWKDVLQDRSLDENLRILLRVSDAVAFANSRGVVHRDLKPENIMLGEFGEVLVMDWGLALVIGIHNEGNATLGGTPACMAPEMAMGPISRIGAHSDIYLLGAILFELLTGRKPHTGTDAMKCLLAAARNEIVAHEHSGEPVDVALKAMSTRPEDRYASAGEFQQAIRDYLSHEESVALQRIAAASLKLARESGDYEAYAQARFGFQNATELWDGNEKARQGLTATQTATARTALEKGDFELGLSVLQSNISEHRELREQLFLAQSDRDARQHRLKTVRRTAMGLTVGIVAVMLVAIVWISRAEQNARFAEAVAVRQREIAQNQQSRAEHNFTMARAAVDQMLTEVGDQQLQYVPQMESVRRSLLNKALEFYTRFLNDQPDDPALRSDAARAQHRVGDISRMLGRNAEADIAYQRAISLFDELVVDFPENLKYQQLLAESHNWLGDLLRASGDPEQAETHFKQASQQQFALVKLAPNQATYRREFARTEYNLGLMYWATNRPVEARASYESAVSELTILVDADSRSIDELDAGAAQVRQELARAYLNRGILNRGTKMIEDARSDYDAAIDILKQLSAASPQNAEYRRELATVLNNLGNLLLPDQSQYAEAETVYRAGLTLLEMLVHDFPSTPVYRKELANAVNSLAALSYYDKDFTMAEQLWDRSREIARILVNMQPEVPEYRNLLAQTLGNLGTLKFKEQELEQARQLLLAAVESQRAVVQMNPKNQDFRMALRNYVWSLTEAHLALKDHASAAAAAATLPQVLPDDMGEYYRAATLLARCVAIVQSDESKPVSERQAAGMRYAADAVAALNAALDRDWDDLQNLDSNEAFSAIRESSLFQAARARLVEKKPR